MGDRKTQSHNITPASDIILRVSNELQNIAATLSEISIPVADALAHNAGVRHPPFIRAMQELDHMRQAIAGLSDFLEAFANIFPESWRLNPEVSAMSVTLSKLADRLCAKEKHPSDPEISEGEWELF